MGGTFSKNRYIQIWSLVCNKVTLSDYNFQIILGLINNFSYIFVVLINIQNLKNERKRH